MLFCALRKVSTTARSQASGRNCQSEKHAFLNASWQKLSWNLVSVLTFAAVWVFFFSLYMHKRVFLHGLSLKAFLSDSTEPILGHALLYLSILQDVMLMEL